jgi:hypothetical protein
MPGKIIEGRNLKPQDWTLMPDFHAAGSGACAPTCSSFPEMGVAVSTST